ncbi:hypothetical protein HK414_16935 [Ramlibacter terrae]|uniref:MFS transporter permease n=1 Tax=Ramlibacter terrae TaxID=2732511 RepID=A0ABX6P4V8_9BURK|nr:hypothetical protein HK414_16935 [Ramlibacter terrae]
MEWWTYSLSDFLMFSPRVYARLVAGYNEAAWPAQVPALLAGLALLSRIAKPRPALLLLAAARAVAGWAFHWTRYAEIFLGAPWLAGACGVQALGCAGAAWLPVREPSAAFRRSGVALMIAGLVLLPLATAWGAQDWRRAEVFGLMPDPTALVTLGWLLSTTALPTWTRLTLAVLPALSLLVGIAHRVALAQ